MKNGKPTITKHSDHRVSKGSNPVRSPKPKKEKIKYEKSKPKRG